MLSRSPQVPLKIRRIWQRLSATLHASMIAATLLSALGCWQGKISQAGEENGPEEAAVFVVAAQPMRIITRHAHHPVYIVPVHTNARRVMSSIADVENIPDEGHRYANGLLAPLRT